MERLGYREIRTPYRRADRRSSSGRSARRPTSSRRRCTPSSATASAHAAARGHGGRGPRVRRARGPQQGAGHALVLPRPDVPRRSGPAQGPLPPVLPGSAPSASATPGPGCDAEMIDAARRLPRASIGIAKLDVFTSTRSARAGTRATLPRRARRALHADEGQAQRRLAAPARDEPAPHPRLEGPRATPRRSRARRRSSISSTTPTARTGTGSARYLDALGVRPTWSIRKLVRGLDYYTRTLFEIKGAYDKLGARSTLVGGGRYDGMIEELGGPRRPGDRLRGGPRAPAHRELVDGRRRAWSTCSSRRSAKRPTAGARPRPRRSARRPPLRGRHAQGLDEGACSAGRTRSARASA